MRDGLADGLARVRERVSTLRGDGDSPGRDRYVLLPAGSGRRRRLAEIGAAAGAVVVVLAFVGATVALRPTSSPQPDTPGLPAPTESLPSVSPSSAPATASTSAVPTGRPTVGAPPQTTRYTPSATAAAPATTPAPTTTATTPAPPRTTPPRTTPPPSATPTTTPTATPTATPTTEPPAPAADVHPFG
jgi:hypothetical protein